MFCWGVGDILAAGPRLTLDPSTSNPPIGENFTVTIGVDSGSEISAAVDVFGKIDTSKMEIVSIEKASDPAYDFEMVPSEGFESSGEFNFACVSNSNSSGDDKIIKGDLAVITLKPKTTGWAYLNFVCTSGVTSDSNIFNDKNADVIQCNLNDSGKYNIGGSTDDITPTNTPTPIPTTAETDDPTPTEADDPTPTSSSGGGDECDSTIDDCDTLNDDTPTGTTKTKTVVKTVTRIAGTSSELPKTGATGATLGLIIFGTVSLLSAVFLKFL